MGGTMSTIISKDAYICRYNKESFNKKLDIIRDAHEVSQYYASILLIYKLPIKLEHYKNYSEATKKYFNSVRKHKLDDLYTSYYEFYIFLQSLQELYENTYNNENDRLEIITDVFNRCYTVQKYIIKDLWEDCNRQLL